MLPGCCRAAVTTPSFGPSSHPGRVIYSPDGAGSQPFEFVGASLTADGGVVLSGMYRSQDGTYHDLFVELGADGDFYHSTGNFGASNTTSYSMSAIATADDGKIIVVSNEWVGGIPLIAVRRMLINGQGLDSSFGEHAGGAKLIAVGNFAVAKAVALQADGRIPRSGLFVRRYPCAAPAPSNT